MDGHAEFLRFGPAGITNFSSWPNHFGRSLSSLPQSSPSLAIVTVHNGTKSGLYTLSTHRTLPSRSTKPTDNTRGIIDWLLRASVLTTVQTVTK